MEISQDNLESIKDFNDTNDYLNKNIKIHGKSLKEWEIHFKIPIPDTVDILSTQKAIMRLNMCIQECSDIYDGLNVSSRYIEMNYNDSINKEKGNILTAKDVKTNNRATAIAESKFTQLKKAQTFGEILALFFEGQLKKLRTLSKNFETLANSQMSELKTFNRFRSNSISE